jgi:hypothetical protein
VSSTTSAVFIPTPIAEPFRIAVIDENAQLQKRAALYLSFFNSDAFAVPFENEAAEFTVDGAGYLRNKYLFVGEEEAVETAIIRIFENVPTGLRFWNFPNGEARLFGASKFCLDGMNHIYTSVDGDFCVRPCRLLLDRKFIPCAASSRDYT